MEKDNLDQLISEASAFSLQEIILKTSFSERAATIAGFSVCAGYLAAIFQQLRSDRPLTREEFEEFYALGRQDVLETFHRAKGFERPGDKQG